MIDHADRCRLAMAGSLSPATLRTKRIAPHALSVCLLCTALALTIERSPSPHLIWNVSASAPKGLYRVDSRGRIARGAMVIARMPASWRAFAARRHYLPANVPLVKRVAAVTGDRVCATGSTLLINGSRRASRLAFDRDGRRMPRWSGCVTLGSHEYLLLMESPGSFDGRYFGPSARSDILGTAKLLWRN